MFESLSTAKDLFLQKLLLSILVTFIFHLLPLFLMYLLKSVICLLLNHYILCNIFATTPAQAAADDMELHPTFKDSLISANLTHPMEFFIPKVVPARLTSELTIPKNQSVPKFWLLDRKTNQISLLKSHKEGCCKFNLKELSKPPLNLLVIATEFEPNQGSIFVFLSALMDYKC